MAFKKWLCLLTVAVLLLGLSGCAGEGTYKEENKLKIISYNVRCANDGKNKNIKDRAPRLKEVIDRYDPDVMGFQEVTPTWLSQLDFDLFEEYDYVYMEREFNGESTPVFWKRDKFELMEEGHFWLSDTPEEESKGWGGSYYRVVSWVRLKIKETGKQFLHFNTHYDFSDDFHVNASQLILDRIKEAGGFKKYPVFLTGDFNMLAWGLGYNALTEDGRLVDVNFALENDPTPTTNGYNESNGGRIIDFCFYSPKKAVPLSYKVLNEKINDGYVSDHRGVYVEATVL